MSELRRWRDSGDAPDDVRRMFDAGRPTREMSDRARSRMTRRLAGPLASVAAVTYVLTWKSVAIAAVVAMATATGVVAAVRVAQPKSVVEPVEVRPAEPPHGVKPQPPPPPSLPNEPPASSITVVEPAPPPISSGAATGGPAVSLRPPAQTANAVVAPAPVDMPSSAAGAAAPSTPPVDTLAAELELLEQARASYDRDPAQTLAVLNEHARRFPAGKLSLERELLALDALKRLGMVSSERARAERLLPQVRGTIYEQRVRSHLEPPASP
jgi:hypothetical protein